VKDEIGFVTAETVDDVLATALEVHAEAP